MTRQDSVRAAAALQALISILLTIGATTDPVAAAALRQAVGSLSASALDKVRAWGFSDDIDACFEAATAAGADIRGMGQVAVSAEAMTPVGPAEVAVVQYCLRSAMIQQSRILAKTTFVSRTDVDTALAAFNATMDPAEEFAADNAGADVYRTLVALHGSTVRDLVQRARPLPKVASYSTTTSLPALVLAQRLYGDASRADELRAENQVTHPLFMPRTGRSLSA